MLPMEALMAETETQAQYPNLIKGRLGVRSKRAQEGEDYAKEILAQEDDDILVTTDENGDEIQMDRHRRAQADPVFRALRRQAREGVGTMPGQMPPAVFNALADRAWGKVVEKVKQVGGRPYAGENEEQLADRLEQLKASLRTKAKVA